MNAVQQQERIAFHESAHCCIFRYFKRPVASVEIGEDTGRCVLPTEWQQRFGDDKIGELAKRESLIQHIIACCAGKAAMDHFHGYKAASDENWRASDDYQQARKHALRLNDGDAQGAELLIAWAARRAELLVERQWSQIHKLAFALLDTNELKLNGNQIHGLLR
jgi:hypothetical protein